MEQWLVIGISGVTCSGKTTLAQSLYERFKEKSGHEIRTGVEVGRVELVNQDQYFREVDDPNHVRVEQLNHLNWEIIQSLDMEKMTNDIMSLLGPNFVLYNTKSSRATSPKSLFSENYADKQIFQKTRRHAGSDDGFMDDDQCKHMKIIKQDSLLNILIVEGFLIFNHAVTFDLCNVKYHLHVPYEVCYARRKNRTYDPPDVPCK